MFHLKITMTASKNYSMNEYSVLATPDLLSQRRPRQERTGLTDTGVRRAASRPARSRSRSFALQGLYQFLVGADDATGIDAFTRDLAGFHKCDAAHFDALLHGCINEHASLDALIAPKLDRTVAELSPIERACMWVGAYELLHAQDIPWRVVLNESVELAKEFGGTDGHKYVNAVLNALAHDIRAEQVAADPGATTRPVEKKTKAIMAENPMENQAQNPAENI